MSLEWTSFRTWKTQGREYTFEVIENPETGMYDLYASLPDGFCLAVGNDEPFDDPTAAFKFAEEMDGE